MKYHVRVNAKNGMFLKHIWYALNIFKPFLGSPEANAMLQMIYLLAHLPSIMAEKRRHGKSN